VLWDITIIPNVAATDVTVPHGSSLSSEPSVSEDDLEANQCEAIKVQEAMKKAQEDM